MAMRKMTTGFMAAVIAAAALASASAAAAQNRQPGELLQPFGLLQAPGSAIGASVRDLTSAERANAKIGDAGAALVESVVEGTPASRTGLREDDIVVEFDGERVRSARHLTRVVQETVAGRTVQIAIVRNGSRQVLEITPEPASRIAQEGRHRPRLRPDLRALPDDRLFEMPYPSEPFGLRRRMGTTLLPLNDQLASYFGVQRGVLVSSVDPNSGAAKGGLKAGDVIIAVNGKGVADPASVRDAVRRAGSKTVLEVAIVRDRKDQTIRIPASN
jgi:serine protease Do